MTGTSSTLFWITSRAAGTTAMVLASAAVGLGLTMGGRMVRWGGPQRRTLHEVLSLATIFAVVVHALSLLGDSWLHPSLLQLTVPFTAAYQTLYTSIGIVAGWGMAVLGLAFYARRRIGQARWRSIHRFTALAWLLALVHTFSEGTDAGRTWFIALILAPAVPALALLLIRHTGLKRRRRSARGGPGALSVRPT